MAVTAVAKRTVTIDGLSVSDSTNTYTDDGAFKFQVSVPAGTVALPVHFAVKAAAIKAIAIDGSQVTHVFTNNATEGSATNVFIVSPNNELQWWADAPTANPITADVTSFYITVPGAIASTVTIAMLYHVET